MTINTMFDGARRIAKLNAVLIVGLAMLSVSGCGEKDVPDDQVFTLYQNAPSDPSARIGLATFDMKWGDANNHYYCTKFAGFVQAEWDANGGKATLVPGVKEVRHWCEKGRYKK